MCREPIYPEIDLASIENDAFDSSFKERLDQSLDIADQNQIQRQTVYCLLSYLLSLIVYTNILINFLEEEVQTENIDPNRFDIQVRATNNADGSVLLNIQISKLYNIIYFNFII